MINKHGVRIPGLVHGTKDKAHDKLNEQEVQHVRKEFEKYINSQDEANRLGEMIANSNSSSSSTWMTYDQAKAVGLPVAANNYLIDPALINGNTGTNYYKDYDPYKQFPMTAPSPLPMTPQKMTRIPQRGEDAQKYIQDMLKPKKSDFESLIDTLFSRAEKEQFLIDAGYLLERADATNSPYPQDDPIIMRKLSDGTVKKISNSLDDLFLREITVKFKNLLLAKSVLKLKL